MLPDNRRTSNRYTSNTRRRRKITKKKERRTPKFLTMSKLLGLFIMVAIVVVIRYAMYEMHYQNNLDSLPQLIISIFGLGSVYIGFYLTMAKFEHVEYEKTKREKEILKLKKQLQLYNDKEQIEEDLIDCNEELNDLENLANDLANREIGE